jgi:hypothetical protein
MQAHRRQGAKRQSEAKMRGCLGRSPPSESPSEPAAKKKRGLGANIDGLKLKLSELEESVSVAATGVVSKSLISASLQNSNTQDKLGSEELHISHVLSQLNDERDAHNSTRIILKHEREINEGDTTIIRQMYWLFRMTRME